MTAALAGQLVGPYRVERLLARGGMGEAYLAREERTGAAVLLKLPAPEVLGDVAAHTRFERESAALRRLDHPGVQRWLATGSVGLRPYVALEYVAGRSLRDVQRATGGGLPVSDVVRVGAVLAEALAYCHGRGVVHRDLKPDNVIVTDDGHPVLIDFGSALLEGARRLTFSKLSGELGTPEYMAPEQVQGKRGDARTDEYALATLLYELLTGRPPFAAAPGDGAVEVMRRHLTDSPPPPEAPGLSDALQGVLARALHREPDQRFPDLVAFRRALLDPPAAVAEGKVQPGWPAAATGGTRWAPLDEPRSLRDWLRYALLAAVTLAALVAIGFLASVLRPTGS